MKSSHGLSVQVCVCTLFVNVPATCLMGDLKQPSNHIAVRGKELLSAGLSI